MSSPRMPSRLAARSVGGAAERPSRRPHGLSTRSRIDPGNAVHSNLVGRPAFAKIRTWCRFLGLRHHGRRALKPWGKGCIRWTAVGSRRPSDRSSRPARRGKQRELAVGWFALSARYRLGPARSSGPRMPRGSGSPPVPFPGHAAHLPCLHPIHLALRSPRPELPSAGSGFSPGRSSLPWLTCGCRSLSLRARVKSPSSRMPVG